MGSMPLQVTQKQMTVFCCIPCFCIYSDMLGANLLDIYWMHISDPIIKIHNLVSKRLAYTGYNTKKMEGNKVLSYTSYLES